MSPASRRLFSIGVCALMLIIASARAAAPQSAADRLVKAYLDAWNGVPGQPGAALAPDFVDSTTLLPLDGAGFTAEIGAWRGAIPHLKVSLLERTSAAGEEVLRLRFEGRPANPAELLPVTGGTVAIEQTERLRIHDGKIFSRQASVDEWTVPSELLFAAPPAFPYEPLSASVVARFGPGQFLESIALASDGTPFVSTGPAGIIASLDAEGRQHPFATLDVGPRGFVMCLAFDLKGRLYVTVISANPAVHGVWRFTSDGHGARITTLPPGSAPNGLALDEAHGLMLIADSFGGVIWRAAMSGGAGEAWIRDPLLAPRPLVGRFPGANGLQRAGTAVLVTVSDRGLLLRVPITSTGAAGPVEVVAAGLPGDDFAVAPDGGVYVTTHPFNTVIHVSRDGRRRVIAGPEQEVVGPTSAALTPDGKFLYVATDGGLYRPLPGRPPVARVVKLQLTPGSSATSAAIRTPGASLTSGAVQTSGAHLLPGPAGSPGIRGPAADAHAR